MVAQAESALAFAEQLLGGLTVSKEDRARAAKALVADVDALAWFSVVRATEWSRRKFALASAPGFATRMRELETLIRTARRQVPVVRVATEEDEDPGEKPSIRVDEGQADDAVAAAWAAVRRWDGARLFVKSGCLVTVVPVGDSVHVRRCTESYAMAMLIRSATWWKTAAQGGGGEVVPCLPPPQFIATDMVAAPHPELQELETVGYAPVFTPEGELVDGHGYHEGVRAWLQEPVDVRPMGRGEAVALLREWLSDFPFATPADRCHAYGLFLLPFVRTMIAGPTPVHLIEASDVGTGKTLLARVLIMGATRRDTPLTTIGDKEEELKKVITSALLAGRPVILFDNVKGAVESPSLEAVTTSTTWVDRLMGGNDEVELPVRSAWVMTANNAALSSDMTRRAVRIRIVRASERPSEEGGFRHPDLIRWTREKHPDLVAAAVRLITDWVDAGRPGPGKVMGTYEDWCAVVGGILTHAGFDDFLGNREALQESANADRAEWAELVTRWWDRYGTDTVATTELMDLTEAKSAEGRTPARAPILQEIYGTATTPSGRAVKLGRALRQKVEQTYGKRIIVKSKSGISGWKLMSVDVWRSTHEESPAEDSSPPTSPALPVSPSAPEVHVPTTDDGVVW